MPKINKKQNKKNKKRHATPEISIFAKIGWKRGPWGLPPAFFGTRRRQNRAKSEQIQKTNKNHKKIQNCITKGAVPEGARSYPSIELFYLDKTGNKKNIKKVTGRVDAMVHPVPLFTMKFRGRTKNTQKTCFFGRRQIHSFGIG